MASRILNIMNSPRREIEVQGYSKYNNVKRDFLQIKKEEIERKRSIEIINTDMTDRIGKMKPSIGSMK